MLHPVCVEQADVLRVSCAGSLWLKVLNAVSLAGLLENRLTVLERQDVKKKTGQMTIRHLTSEFGCGGRI